MRLQQAVVLVQFLRQCDEVMFWINNKETFVTTEELSHDLEHFEVLQSLSKVSSCYKQNAELEAWARLKSLAAERQQKLLGAHQIQRFNRNADETIAWIAEKGSVLSTDDYFRIFQAFKLSKENMKGQQTCR